jgi:hypothetical protein
MRRIVMVLADSISSISNEAKGKTVLAVAIAQPSKDNIMISLVELKRLAQTLLPKSSMLRSIILTEPDYLSRQEAAIKAGIFAKMLGEEISKGR